jgi:putative DNA modification/repair radical SAM protein
MLRRKLQVLADAAKYDASCASSGSKRSGNGKGIGHTTGSGICHSYTPDGRCVSLLKILLTNFCIYDCQYCVNRVTSDTPRERFTVDEVVNLTLEFYKRNYIEGLFLSSGVIQSADYTMEQLISVAQTLRLRHHFNGYIHLKAVPGASEELQRQAGLYADRLSANIELPTAHDLKRLAPEKKVKEIDATMTQIKSGIDASNDRSHTGKRPPRFAPGGQSTQMIVGATPSTDTDILATATRLYGQHKLRRVYYSAYSPIPFADGRLPSQQPPLIREHRLYQADWLMRFYGFTAHEITTPQAPDLDLKIDPKLAWALRNRHRFPVDLNKAPREMLLRVPGLGARNVDRLIVQRRFRKIRLADLSKLRTPMAKVKPWVIAEDFNADALRIDRDDLRDRIVKPAQQMELFASLAATQTGQL